MTLEERLAIVNAAERSPTERAWFLAAIDDPVGGDAFFINTCAMSFDPRKVRDERTGDLRPIGYVPMLLWPEQEKAANTIGWCMDNERDCGGEKSRDMGMTWIIELCGIKRFLRQPGFSMLIGAMTQNLLDDEKNPATLFWKIDCVLKHLPQFLMPGGMKWDAFRKKYRSPADMINPENGNTINGNAPTARFAVGDRKSVVYFDDWAQWEYGEEAWNFAAATTNCRIASWTANGLNHAYDLRFGKNGFEGVKVKIVNIHWSSDPRKQKKAIDPYSGKEYNIWLREQIGDPDAYNPETGQIGIPGRITMQKFKRDYEMVYELGDDKAIYALQMERARKGNFPHDSRLGLYTFWDYGRSNRTAIVFAQFDHKSGRLRIIAYQEWQGEEIGYYTPLVMGRPEGTGRLPYEGQYTREQLEHIERVTSWQEYSHHKGTYVVPYRDHFGDPTGRNKMLTSKQSVVEQLAEAGIVVNSRRDKEGWEVLERIDDARWILSLCDIDEKHCHQFIDRMNRYRWKESEKIPEHDANSDCATAFEYGAVNMRPLIEDWYRGKRESFETKKIQAATFDGLTPVQREAERARERQLRKALREAHPEDEAGQVWTLSGQRILGAQRGGGYADDW